MTATDTTPPEEAWAQLVNDTLRRLYQRLDEQDAWIAAIDDRTPSRRSVEELHNRVDTIEKRMSR